MSSCCEAKVVWYKGGYVCSCCGMPHRKVLE